MIPLGLESYLILINTKFTPSHFHSIFLVIQWDKLEDTLAMRLGICKYKSHNHFVVCM